MLLLGLGGVLMLGIGDGHPTAGMKIIGGTFLAVLALLTIGTVVLNLSLLIRLLFQRTISWRFRIYFLIGVASILTLFFVYHERG